MWEYVPILAAFSLALLQLAKDWSSHQKTWRRTAVLVSILVLCVSSAVITWNRQTHIAMLERAELEASLGDVTDKLTNLELKEKVLTKQEDGTLTFTFLVVNKGAVQARNGSIYLEICNTCEFSDEPREFFKAVGAPDQQRQRKFQILDAMTAIAVPLRIKTPPPAPPSNYHRIEIGVHLRCENCVLRPKDSLWVAYRIPPASAP